MKIVIILNGYPRSGKDSFAKFIGQALLDKGVQTDIVSSVCNVKDAAKILGWDGEKTEANRKALSDLKDLSTKYWEGPFNLMSNCVMKMKENHCFVFMIREPEEIEKFVARFPQSVSVFMKRDEAKIDCLNHADQNVENYIYDYYIYNNRDLKNLSTQAQLLIERIIYYGQTR